MRRSNSSIYKDPLDEQNEASKGLLMIKKEHDLTKSQAKRAENKIINFEVLFIQKTLKTLDDQVDIATSDMMINENKFQSINNACEETKTQHTQEMLNQKCLKHMVERLHKDLLSLKAKNTKLESSLSYKTKLKVSEEHSCQSTNEQHIHAKRELSSLMDQIDKEQKDREQHLMNLKKKIDQNEMITEKKIEMLKRRAEISETASSENTDLTEKKIKGQFLANKMWNSFLKRKMERYMEKNREIEMAFQRIKNVTGIVDIQEVVRKFLTKESTY